MAKTHRVKRSRERVEALLDELAVPVHERSFYLKEELQGDDPPLPGLVFEREVKQVLIGRNDTAWIEDSIAQLESLEAGSSQFLFCASDPQLLSAFRAFKVSGMDPSALSTIVNAAQENLLNAIVHLLEEGQAEDNFEDVQWGLFEVDEDGRPGRRLESLSRFLSLPLQ